MATIKDAEDAWLQAKAEFETWKADFEREWFAPLGRDLIAGLIAQLNDEQLALLRQMNPEQYDLLMQTLEEV